LKQWRTPAGSAYNIYLDALAQTHLLIAGATGSGKSVLVNGLIYTALFRSPAAVGLILIDPKRVELAPYRPAPHVLRYASEPDTMPAALRYAIELTEARYKLMQAAGRRKFDGADVYVVIDELADLMTTARKEVQPLIQRLCQIGRAARVHVVACTQCPISAVIPTPIKVNFDSRFALRTRSAQDSRNILGRTGCELLPRYGQAYYLTPEGLTLYTVPMIPDDDINRRVTWWKKQAPRTRAR
jgi:S-DNA-T family DNA segregation ATPase FtsK/SpoIIIE